MHNKIGSEGDGKMAKQQTQKADGMTQNKQNSQKQKTKQQNSKKQNAQSVKQGNTVMGLLVIAMLVFICVISNARGAAFYDYAKFGNLCITTVFVLFWSAFPVLYKNNEVLVKISFVINLLMLIAATNGLLLRLLDTGGFLSAALVSIVAVPFYGLRIVLGWTGTYAVATVITFWWMLYSGVTMRRLQERRNRKPNCKNCQ